ncbi:helix-hairpin-helix domain-containing protein [Fusobacterium perfoetens]|nr:helix-hairpin-helix domain-containing protein [Fusobacterium perfoetens]
MSIFSFGAKYKMIISDNASGKLDINKATREEMLRSGVAESYVSKIISFRDIKGGIENINELESVSGIGEKTCEKLKKYFFINEIPNIKPLYINKADDKILSYYGFNKKEIKNIRKFLEKNKKIKNNIILKKVISQNKYEKYKDIIRYDVY